MATFYNQATLTYNGVTTTSNTTTGQLVDVLSAGKSLLVDSYTAGQELTYIITLVNSGTTAFTDLTVTDNLGSYTYNTQTLVPLTYVTGSLQYYVNGTLQTTPTVTAASPLTVTGISVPAGGNAVIAYVAQVNTYAPLDVNDTVVNTATITGTGLSTPLTATATALSAVDPTLTISKSLSPTTVSENGQITYTFIIENSGNTAAEASAAVVVADTFDPVLNPITVTLNGTALTLTTDYTYNPATGAFATVAGVVTVPAATYTQDTATGAWTIVPGTTTLIVTGTV